MRSGRRHPERGDTAVLARIAHDDDLEEQTVAREFLERLFDAEPVSSRVIAVLNLHDGMTLEEVSRATGMSVSGVRKRLRTLRTKLRVLSNAVAAS